MENNRNSSEKQLSASNWLENHHMAKEKIRYEFSKKLLECKPKTVIDIGCGTGLWLNLLNNIFPKDCKFIGVDIDQISLDEAKKKSETWERPCEWLAIDINKDIQKIPPADLVLIFNVTSYIDNLKKLFFELSEKKGFKNIALRQFAGDEIRFGPFPTKVHNHIDLSIKDSMVGSSQIKYFDMDRTIHLSSLTNREIIFQDFELFRAFTPFQDHQKPYILGTAEWMEKRVATNEKAYIDKWISDVKRDKKGLYFFSVDWISILR